VFLNNGSIFNQYGIHDIRPTKIQRPLYAAASSKLKGENLNELLTSREADSQPLPLSKRKKM